MSALRARALFSSLAFSFLAVANAQPAGPAPTGPAPATTPESAPLTKEAKEEVLTALEEVVTKQAFVPGVDLTKWPEFLAKQREAIDQTDKDSEFARAVNTAMRDFGISHIRFLPPRAATARKATTAIGIGVRTRAGTDGLAVTFVYPKSPADVAGIRAGDVIIDVDGKLPESADAIQGAEGSEAILKVRAADGAIREHRLKRLPYSTNRPDTLTWIGEDAAVLKVHSFNKGYEREAIEKLIAEAGRAKYLVIDLRSNGGGAVTNLRHLLGFFLPSESVIGTFVNRQTVAAYSKRNAGKVETDPVIIAKDAERRYTTRKSDATPFKGRVAVLINRGSASASEIFAAAAREHLKAPIVGSRSAGAVLASVFRPLPRGFEVQYPVSDYVTRDGMRLEKNPIVPDIEVTQRGEEGKDPAVEKALERLRTGATFLAGLPWAA